MLAIVEPDGKPCVLIMKKAQLSLKYVEADGRLGILFFGQNSPVIKTKLSEKKNVASVSVSCGLKDTCY